MPIYPRPDKGPNTWAIQVSARGHRVTRLFRGTITQARDEEARLRVEVGAGRQLAASAVPTLSELSRNEYWPTARVTLAPGTRRNRRYQIATLEAFFGAMRLDKIRTSDIAAFVQERRDDGKNDTTIADDLKVLRKMLNFAREQKRLGELPKFPLVKAKATSGRVKFWTAAQVERLFAAAKERRPRMYPLLVFLLNTGCRKTEAIRTRWAGVDFRSGTIWIAPVREDDLDWQPKDGEAREVPMSATLRAVLRKLPRRGDYVFPTEEGTPFAFWPQRDFDEVRDAAGLEGGPHTTRHTYATHFLAAGGDMFRLSRILGQEEARVTEIYSHLLPGRIAATSALVDFGAKAPQKEKASAKASGKRGRRNTTAPNHATIRGRGRGAGEEI